MGSNHRPLACKLSAPCRLLSFTWEFGLSPSDPLGRSRMSLWSTLVVSIHAHGSRGGWWSISLPVRLRSAWVAAPHVERRTVFELKAPSAVRRPPRPDILWHVIQPDLLGVFTLATDDIDCLRVLCITMSLWGEYLYVCNARFTARAGRSRLGVADGGAGGVDRPS